MTALLQEHTTQTSGTPGPIPGAGAVGRSPGRPVAEGDALCKGPTKVRVGPRQHPPSSTMKSPRPPWAFRGWLGTAPGWTRGGDIGISLGKHQKLSSGGEEPSPDPKGWLGWNGRLPPPQWGTKLSSANPPSSKLDTIWRAGFASVPCSEGFRVFTISRDLRWSTGKSITIESP